VKNLFNLDGRVAVITGSTAGMGLAMARALAIAGASVVVSGRDAARSQEAAATLKAEGHKAEGIPCDITDPESIAAFATDALRAFGRVDVLILNAAGAGLPGSILKQSSEDFETVMHANVSGNITLANALLPQMMERHDGSIMFMSSRTAKRGTAVLGLYGVSKAAIDMLTRSLAIELGPHGINVNSICPGPVRTEFSRAALWGDPEREKKLVATIPMGRIGEPEDVAGLAVLLASPAGRFITGQNISVDGGGTA
jgi:NAD(P)-dependent dehydrogenase (short-subunit alcohol dehydrogenase family)